jgi:hypothetical protein
MRRTLVIGALLAALLVAPSAAQALGPGTVRGTVRPQAVASEVEVCVLESQPSETCAYPAADGSYVLKGVPLGPNIVEFVPSYRSRYVTQYYDHATLATKAKTISMTLNPVHLEEDAVDADLLVGGQLEGIVSAASGGAPLAEVEVCAFSAIDVSAGCDRTNAGGEYALPTLPAGTYKVGFFGREGSADYVSEYYGGSSSYTASPPVSVFAGATRTEIDAQLERGGAISGTVSAAAGGPLPGISVCLFPGATMRPQRCSFSDELGEYSFTGLASGSFKVGFSLSSAELAGEAGGAVEEDAFLSQYYAGAPTLAAAQPIAVTAPGAVPGVDASLLTPQAPPPAPPAALPAQIVPAPRVISEPPAKKKAGKCKRGYRKRKVKGKARCVKAGKHRKKGSGERGRG